MSDHDTARALETTLSVGDTRVRVRHRWCNELPSRTDDALLLGAESREPDTLTTVSIGVLGVERDVLVHWTSAGSPFGFNLRYEDTTEVLFVGAGTLSTAINVRTLTIIDENIVDLFWDFVPYREFVLELGELECRLHRKDGTCVGKAVVDPPYEWHEDDTGLIFNSLIFGEQRIAFPTT